MVITKEYCVVKHSIQEAKPRQGFLGAAPKSRGDRTHEGGRTHASGLDISDKQLLVVYVMNILI